MNGWFSNGMLRYIPFAPTATTWRLFLRFVADRRQRTVAQLGLADLTASEVSAFLHHAEYQRGDTIGTRNCRLAALRSFFGFVAGREPSAIAQCTEILQIPTKRAPIHAPCYLEPEEVKAILAQPDCFTSEGQRDHILLSFLYNTGARIQEALEVRPQAIRFDSPACARLYCKGRKERLCPLWPETVSLLRALLKRQPRSDDERLFVNRYGAPLIEDFHRVMAELSERCEKAGRDSRSLSISILLWVIRRSRNCTAIEN